MKAMLLLTLVLLLSLSGQTSANFGGELELGSALQKSEEWDLNFNSKLKLIWRERGDNFRLDVQVSGELPAADENDTIDLELDRLSLRFFGQPWDVSLGKQPISWGVGTSWPEIKSPLNLYPDNVWGVSLRIPTAPLAFWTVNATDYADSILYSVRKQDYWQGLRWSAMMATDGDQWMIGLDGKVDVGFELYGDALYYLAPDQQLKLLLGADYSLGPFVAATEYRYNGGDSYLFQGITYAFDDFTSGSVGVDISLQDGSHLWFAGLEAHLFNDWAITVGASFPRGDGESEYGRHRAWFTQRYEAKLTYSF